MTTAPGGRRRTAAATVLVALAAGSLAACSGGGDDDSDAPAAAASTGPPPLATTASLGEVAGRLSRPDGARVVKAVTGVFDQWVDAAYLGDFPRKDFSDAFDAFTTDAAGRARKESGLLSDAQVGERVDAVTASRRHLVVDVLAPEGKVAGATARFTLVLDLTGDLERTDTVSGRLTLTPQGKDWKVFGWSVSRKAST